MLEAPRPEPEPEPSTRAEAAYLLLTLGFVALLALPSLLYPFGLDQAMFAYVGDRWLHGGLPYRDAWDIKPAGIFAIYAAAQVVFGRGMAAARFADLAAALAACAGLYALARQWRWSPRAACLPAVMFGIVYYTGFDYWNSAQVESFAAPLTILLLLALFRLRESRRYGWAACAGLCLGLLLVLKTTFLLFAPLVMIAVMRPGRANLRPLVAFTGAMILPLAVTVAYFAAKGCAGSLLELLVVQQAYARVPGNDVPWVAFLLWRFIRNHPAMWLLWLPALLTIRLPIRRIAKEYGVVWGWWGLATLQVFVQQRFFYYHFLVTLPPLALLATRGLLDGRRWALRMRWSSVRAVANPALLAAALLPVAFHATTCGLAWSYWTGKITRWQYWGCFNEVGSYPFANSAHIAQYLRTHSRPSDLVLDYDFDPAVYFLSERVSPTRHLSMAPIIGQTQIPAAIRNRWRREQERDTAARPPLYLVVLGCPHCYGMAPVHGVVAPVIHYAGHEFEYVATFTKDEVYRRIPAGSSRSVFARADRQ